MAELWKLRQIVILFSFDVKNAFQQGITCVPLAKRSKSGPNDHFGTFSGQNDHFRPFSSLKMQNDEGSIMKKLFHYRRNILRISLEN